MCVEQFEAAEAQPRGEMNQSRLAGISDAREHALAEKRAPQRDAVQAANQFTADARLDAMGKPARVKLEIERANLGIDPGILAILAGRRAGWPGG